MDELISRMALAWERGDAGAYGECFTEDATYVTYIGTLYRGRSEIARSHQALFTKFLAGTKLAWEIVSVQELSADVTVVLTRGDVYRSKRPAKLKKVQTYVFVRGLCVSFQNTQRKPLMESVSFKFAPETVPAS
ncbi:SgcJ/EcaC family oxidoreductase [Catelliglobosispora koreensis]|uniref:SgcJ/EcaC family oxidoreductase n=1 Tax=Catelliglobosispora koreensis TaxID=129052 RepID=UPI00036E7B98|nr:SgcJ/EcaC family oxidoreductase [Catelliglobosispora koreensis]